MAVSRACQLLAQVYAPTIADGAALTALGSRQLPLRSYATELASLSSKPDAVLGAAWPTMSGDLHAPISWAGGISMTISAGTIVSALLSDRMTLRFGAGKVTAVSVALTAFALFGFSISPNYWMLLLFAIPYGLGAGGDVSLGCF